ncbi:MAG: Threonylcarbamoyl-AMP synthase [Alphaproteobacteria bacterium MarineAlpha9_Bin3]|nr:MAG: Threonylcarbamoyl-AMP synthase [Alphaproteobacteria bacterium MarineAlpha9_Bin3]|tara:strand:+ start:4606 stop:5580 length:975 start_codon:yes stop_codon:yes gene_type:complete
MKIFRANKDNIKLAANLINNGGIVAFPTETVYGLGALASNKNAVKRIYRVKGRPENNPLIVHIYKIEQALSIAKIIPSDAIKLIKKYWPGPLTIITAYNSSSNISSVARANLNTVAIRIPNNPIALKLLRLVDAPIIAPSANISQHLSPTSADHVKNDLFNKLDHKKDMILDGGTTKIGLESTVIDFTKKNPTILRPGGLSIKLINEFVKASFDTTKINNHNPLSPGLFKKHYSPKAILRLDADYPIEGEAWLGFGKNPRSINNFININLSKEGNLEEAAKNLFSMLRYLDKLQVRKIAVKKIPNKDIGIAINDRLYRGAANSS